MEAATMVVMARSAQGRRADLIRWLQTQHLPDLLRVPGFERARLWSLEPLLPDQEPVHQTLALYDLRGPDVRQIVSEAARRMGSPDMPKSDALGSPNITYLSRPVIDLSATGAKSKDASS